MIAEYFKMAVTSLRHRRLRSWLTMLGIVIGIGSIVTLISLGSGLQNAIDYQFGKMGTNTLRVIPKEVITAPVGSLGLTQSDADFLETSVKGVKYATPIFMVNAKLEYSGDERYGFTLGYPSDRMLMRFDDFDIDIAEGRVFKSGETKVALIGSYVADGIFDNKIPLRANIMVNDEKFRVVGIFEETGVDEFDNSIYIPIDTLREMEDDPEGVSIILLTADEGVDIEDVGEEAAKDLEKYRGTEDFRIATPTQLLGQFFVVLDMVQLILAGIASISLVVGGVGIMNVMYTAVLQRTQEIGLMKAVGASNENILLLFIVESGVMGLTGGTIGAIGGAVLAKLVGFVAALAGYDFLLILIDVPLIVGSLGFAFIVGVVSGTLPALKAARLNPTSALRYE